MNHLINGPTNVLMINQTINELKVEVCSVVSDSLRPHGLYPTRLLCPWDFPGNSTGVVCHFLLQGIFPTQGSNLGLLHCRQTLSCLSHQGPKSLIITGFVICAYHTL